MSLEVEQSVADTALDELSRGLPVEHRYLTIDGVRIHYAEAGSGPPLLLLHGWPQHWWEWRHVIPALATRYRVICPDIRGLGWSDGAPTRYSFDRLAKDLIDLLDALHIERVRLVGHDWGSAIGYRACLNWPDRFERFVALAGVHPWILDGANWRTLSGPWHVFVLAELGRFTRVQQWISTRSLDAWRHRQRFTGPERDIYLERLDRPDARHATASYYRNLVHREVPEFARHYRLMRLRVPTLHLNGERDPLTAGVPLSFGDYSDDMTFEMVPDCGHFIAEEQPDLLNQRLIEFLGGN